MEGFPRKYEFISEERKLELRLGPPGEEDWGIKNEGTGSTTKTNNYRAKRGNPSSLLSLGHFSNMINTDSKKMFLVAENLEDSWVNENHKKKSTSFSENGPQVLGNTKLSPWSSSQYQQSLPPVMGKESLKDCGSTTVMVEFQNTKKKGFSLASANKTVVPNSSQKRTAPSPVVGWPPIHSSRKNLASGCASKLPAESEVRDEVFTKIAGEKQTEGCRKGLFVKINMDGIPIGRKVDLKTYDTYEKLSSAVDELFRGLLAAQNDPSLCKLQNNQEREKAITGLLDGSGEYTLVYKDNEGDRMLVGDVPWHMFVSTVKRLRVLKSSQLSSLSLGSTQENDQF